jgi:tripartite-type tricarboxylate transporter receptor subunit TctC
MLGRFMGDHIPGKPTIIPQNMPGAGSRGAANWLYKVAPRDGTVIATLSQTTPTDQALDQPGMQFDVRRFNWIGNTVVANNLLFVFARSGAATLEQAKSKPLAIGATGASSPSVLYPQVSNNLLGTKFRIVSGYPSGGDIAIALDRGEVDGHVDSWANLKSTHPGWLREHAVNFLFQVGTKREADLPDVPLWSELGQSEEQRQILEILSGDVTVGRPILTAPDVPPERVRALRRAFDDTLMDPSFIDAASKAHMDFRPIGGEELQSIVNRIAGPRPTSSRWSSRRSRSRTSASCRLVRARRTARPATSNRVPSRARSGQEIDSRDRLSQARFRLGDTVCGGRRHPVSQGDRDGQ